jgi:hypothetical protein
MQVDSATAWTMAGASTRLASRDEFEVVVQHVLAGMSSQRQRARTSAAITTAIGRLEVCRDQAVQRGYDPRATGMLAGKVAALRWAMGEEPVGSGPAARVAAQTAMAGEEIEATITRADLERLLGEVWGHALRLHLPRPAGEIGVAKESVRRLLWYGCHLHWRQAVEAGRETPSPAIWEKAKRVAAWVEADYPDELGPWTAEELGCLEGWLSALRWVCGSEWDFLDL